MNAQETLRHIRSKMRVQRASLAMDEQVRASRSVCERVKRAEIYRRAGVVMAYAAVRGELCIDELMLDALMCGKTLLLPRCAAGGRMTAHRVSDISQLRPGMYGISEPPEEAETIEPQEIDLILVPGLAFGKSGERIGQGGGYYDRFLPASHAVLLGVCHDFALHDELVQHAHDVKMDAVVTPRGWIDCNAHAARERQSAI